MMKHIVLAVSFVITISSPVLGQVDTTFIYNESMPYGKLDLRLSKSESNYYYLQEGKTFSFRSVDGQKTNSYLHLTSWNSEPYQQGELREKFSSSDRFIMNYRLLFPADYKSGTEYPVVLFLHGLKESGNCVDDDCVHATRDYDPNLNVPAAPTDGDFPLYNNDYQLLHGGSNYLNARNRAGGRLADDPALDSRAFPGFVLFPQSNNGWSPSEVESALKILRLVMKKYNVDQNRIYVNGLSKGGYGAFEALKRAPWLFAAGAMFSPIQDANINALNLAPTIQHVPLWIFQGGQDLAPLPRDTEERIRRFRAAGMFIRYTLYSHLGHATWNEAMDEPDFFSWLLGFKNNRLHTFGGSEAICQSGSEGLTLILPPGYREYEWQVNQKTIRITSENSLAVNQSGAYRGRYKYAGSGQWNEWSEEITLGVSQPEGASFKQLSTLHLPDLNGKNEAVLEGEGQYNHYNWYRQGNLIDFPGDADDTLKIATLPSTLGSGLFSLRVADFGKCFSEPSQERRIFFSNASPLNITTPGGLVAEGKSTSEVSLKWTDKSDGELGFEIWRRVSETGAKWVMATVTAANAESFTDVGLRPSTSYDYKVRAVSDQGRSEYFPSGSSSITIETPADKTPPSRPANVNAQLTYVNTITVNWNSAHDDSSIKEYRLYVNGDELPAAIPDTSYILNQLVVNTTYTIQVAAVDAGNNLGPKSEPLTVSTAMTGLFYRHTTGAWNDLASIDWSIYEYEGRIPYFDLSPKRQEDFFNFRYDGYLLISKSGDYEFRVTSNDGSRLKLNDTLIVQNDGIHDAKTVSGSPRNLKSSPYRITVDFFDHMGIDSLLVEYNGPDTDNKWVALSRDVLKSTSEGGSGDIDFSLYPNPAVGGMTTLTMRGGNGDPFGVMILDALGRTVREYHVSEIGRSTITLSDLEATSGMYIITVRQNGNVRSKRLVLSR